MIHKPPMQLPMLALSLLFLSIAAEMSDPIGGQNGLLLAPFGGGLVRELVTIPPKPP
jgi:hypothetical protein